MFSNIKIALGAILSAVVAILVGLVKYQSSRADTAEQKAETASSDLKQAEIINELHEESKKIDEGLANESKEDLRAPSDDSRT